MTAPVTPVVVASGLQSPEGPSFSAQGVLHFVDWDAGNVYRLSQAGGLSVFVHTGGVPTGSRFHPDGRLFVADGDLGILALSPDGGMTVVASEWQGVKFRGPNDLVFAPFGDLYFSDPKGSDPEHPIGNVFLLRAGGEIEQFAGGFQFPNGVALSPDGRSLYLAETYPNWILRFALDDRGHEQSRQVFARLEGGLGPDGMSFGPDGNLYVAHFGKGVVVVIDPQGEVIDELPVGGENPTNLAFWGNTLYVTEVEKHQVVRLDLNPLAAKEGAV
jgi:gluconolactonase